MRKIPAFVWVFAAVLTAQVVPGRYVVELAGEPAAGPRQGLRSAMREPEFAAKRSAVRARQSSARRAVANAGGQVLDNMDTVLNALIVSIPDERAADLSNLPGVVGVHAVRRVRPFLTHALPLHRVPDAWNTLPQGIDSAGAGMKIGMIDTGIDVQHPAFSDSLPPVKGFPKVLFQNDLQFTNSKIIVAKNYTPLLPDGGDPDADDYDGHGTGTATAAAGGLAKSVYGPLSGVAPKAYLGNYKVLGANGGTSDVIAKAIDEAVADGMDVLNISLGSFVVSSSDIAPDEVGTAAIENAAKAGVIVVVAAGNEGPGAGTIGDYATAPDAITAGAIANDRAIGYAITVPDASPYMAFPGDGPSPNQPLTAPLYDIANADPTGLACSALPAGSASGAIALIERGSCNFEDKVNNAAAAGAAAAIIYDNPGGSVFTFGSTTVGAATLPTMFTNLSEGTDLKARIAANAALQGTLDFSGAAEFAARPDLAEFSSRGPSLGAALKPDLLAVGLEIVTGAQRNYPDGESYDPSGFIDTAGTSFSTPLIAGSAAVLKAARPGLTMQQYRSLIVNSASAAASAPGISATVSQGGAGILNLASAMTGNVAVFPTSLNFGSGTGSVTRSLNLTLSNVGGSPDTFSINATPADGSPAPAIDINSVPIDAGASRQIAVNWSVSDLAPGEYQGYLKIAGTTGASVATVPYWFAVPGTDPNGISILYSDFSDSPRSLSTAAVVFRIVDVAGLPYTGSTRPSVTVGAGGGTVRRVYRAGDIAGTYAVDIRTSTGSMRLDIAAGSAGTSVVIPVF